MNGDSLPVSAFVDYADGTFQQGAAAYEKRGVSVTVPEWTAETCVAVQPVRLRLPARRHPSLHSQRRGSRRALPKAPRWSIARCPRASTSSPWPSARSDCTGCGVCVERLPKTKALKMVGQDEPARRAEGLRLHASRTVTVKSDVAGTDNVIKSQYLKPYLEFSGACAGCGETPLRHASSPSSSATVCTSPTPRAAPPSGAVRLPPSPYCMDKNGKGRCLGELPL